MDAAEFARQMEAFTALGVSILGGCCGTTPEFIKALSQLPPAAEDQSGPPLRQGVCSAGRMAEFAGVRVIGERINPTGKKRFQQALRERDFDYIMERAIEQAEAGADILDVNVGLPGLDEAEMMGQVVRAVQSVVDLPLQIDSSDPAAIEAGLAGLQRQGHRQFGERRTRRTCGAILPLVRKIRRRSGGPDHG